MKVSISSLRALGVCSSKLNDFVACFPFNEAEAGVYLTYDNLVHARSSGLEWYYLISLFPPQYALEFLIFVIERNYETLSRELVGTPVECSFDAFERNRRHIFIDRLLDHHDQHGIDWIIDWYQRRDASFVPQGIFDSIKTYCDIDESLLKYFGLPQHRQEHLYIAFCCLIEYIPSVSAADEAFEKFYELVQEIDSSYNL